MKKGILATLLVLFVAVILVRPASAHVLETDGDIGAILHILPDDNPTVGVKTTYELAFSGQTKGFAFAGCDCAVSYLLNNKTIASQQLTASNTLTSTSTYTFDTPGVYTLRVKGMPKPGYSFAPFTLNYSVRVKANSQLTTQPFPITLAIAFGLMIILLLLVAMKADGMLERRKE